MKNAIVRNLVRPLIERLGTMVAAYIIATGADSQLAAQIANGLAAALFVLADFITSKWFRERDVAALLNREVD